MRHLSQATRSRVATNRLSTSGLSGPATNTRAAAIVLVGGLSTRMGADKASLVVDGVSMSDRVLHAVAQAGITTSVIAGTADVPDAQHVLSDASAQGPLAGVVGAWESLQAASDLDPYDPIVVLSCDLPWLVAEVIEQLVTASLSHAYGAVAHDGARPQPLVAAYRPLALAEMTRCFYDGERSLRRCSVDWDLGHVSVQAQLVADADTPEDLRGFTVEWPL